MVRVLYPGSFDPLHNGHLDVIEAAANLFDALVVTVMVNPQKDSSLFDMHERQAMIEETISHLPNATVTTSTPR